MAANKRRGAVEINLDKPRVLRYDLNAFALIEDDLGITLAEIQDVKMSAGNLRTLLWAGLVHEDPELTKTDVGAMIDLGNIGTLQSAFTKAFSASLPGKKDGDDEGNDSAPGTGATPND